ncbi:LuxR C-terminal-related transcriptional regulator [Variovorax sp. YR216]|uniref:LuxR C-terminal-related transcriptional regulator n=1 Tax=Variovorax sp. YR216 TaxID=1882828 RepID=UPI00089B8384|nr:LuxR C-terminal-related transcriptional regulator [Variovorax sp. YR216]SEB24705.1 LuxR family transcriptional regulator, maltose regulon positive regulatory protein [Variovorax sp. YR216]
MNFDNLLVSTKFAPPRIGARYILRKHLLAQLAAVRGATFTLVTGSAGFGKTILLAQWRQELMKEGAEVAWLSLGQEEKQLANFCAYLLAALQRLGIPVEDDMLLEGGSSKSIEAVVAAAVNGAQGLPKELYLIIDDYHHVEDPWAHKLMQRLLDHCPPNLHIAIASRMAPPLSIGRLRVLDKVAEIGLVELPFDLEETRVFFEQNISTVKLSADELRLIHDITSGWPASLQLITVMLRSRPQTRATLQDLGWKLGDLQAYLAEDVIAHLPAEFTRFMEMLSVCRRFNASLAAAVTGSASAGALIKRAEDENLLIYRVDSDDRTPWYRFHPLFGEFLSARLAEQGPARAKELHRRASHWFAEQELLVEAVRHAILGDDLQFAVSSIENAAPSTWSLGYISPMLNLLDRLPQEALHQYPRLFFLACLTYALTARPAQAERWIAQIRETDAAKTPAISSRFALADAAVALQRDNTQRVIDLLEPQGKAPAENRFLRYVHVAALATAYAAAGRYADAHRLLDDNPIPPDDRGNDMALVVQSVRATTLGIEGNAKETARVGAEVLARAETAYGRRSVSANLCAATLGNAFYELDRIDEAREVLANRAGILRSSSPGTMIHAALCNARLDMLQLGPDAALAFLDAQQAHYHSLGLDRLVTAMLAEQVKVLLATGERARAAELVAKLDGLANLHRDAQGFRAEIPALAAIARARLALIDARPDDALVALDAVRGFASAYGRVRMLVLAEILAALTHDYLKRDEQALDCLARAVQSGAAAGLVRTFLDEGPRVGELLGGLRGSGARLDERLGPYVDDLLRRWGGPAPVAQDKGKPSPKAADTDSIALTPREIEILGLVAKAMSSKRIAQTLNITPETVKWNIRNVLAKLRMSSRYDALTWARNKGLIE